MSRTYYYAHIPKTGGTSFTALLDRFFSLTDVFPARVWPRVDAEHSALNQSHRLYRGHFGGGGIKALTDSECQLMTMLRHPTALAQSTYYFTRRQPHIMGHQLVNDEDMKLVDFLQHPQTQFLANDRMTRFLSFDLQDDTAVEGVFLNQKAIDRIAPLMAKKGPKLSPTERLNRAWNFVQQSHWFGLLERFDDSLRLLCYQMKWPPIRQSQKLNQSTKKQVISATEQGLIDQLNQFDNQLYEMASELFNQRHEAMCNTLSKLKTKPNQGWDDLLDLYYQKFGNNQLEKAVDYGFDQPLKGCGWHRRQPIHGGVGQCRWTGPEQRSQIDFWLLPNNYVLSVEIIHAISIDALDGLSLFANNHPIKWSSQSKGVSRTIKANIDRDMIQANGLLRLTMELPGTRPFSELDQSNDERVVGMAVSGIKLNQKE